MSKDERYQPFAVTDDFFCCWDTKEDKPVEVGFAGSYIVSGAHYAYRQAYEKNGRGAGTANWKDDSRPEQLSVPRVVILVSYMCALRDQKIELAPSFLDLVKDKLTTYEADMSELEDHRSKDLNSEWT